MSTNPKPTPRQRLLAEHASLEEQARDEAQLYDEAPVPEGRLTRETLEIALFYLDRAVDADDRGDLTAVHRSLQAGLAAVAAARKLFFGVSAEIGTPDPIYAPNQFTTLEDIELALEEVAAAFGCAMPPRPLVPEPDRLPPTGKAVFASNAGRTKANRIVERVLDDEGEVPPTVAITAACIASLRSGQSPREWLLRLAAQMPDDTVEHREYEHLLRNAAAVRLLIDAGWSIQASQATTGTAIERGPYARPTDDYLV